MQMCTSSTNSKVKGEQHLSALHPYTFNQLGKYAWIGLYGRPAVTRCHGNDRSLAQAYARQDCELNPPYNRTAANSK
jgi:hypothetical protein